MSDNYSIIEPIIHTVSATQITNTVVVSSPGPQGPIGEFQPSSIQTAYPITNASGTIGYNTSYIPASATYSSSAGVSSSTTQTNFNTLTISGSSVATQQYVLANIPASAQYAGSSQYATNAGSSNYAVLSSSANISSSTDYILGSNVSGAVASATISASGTISSSANISASAITSSSAIISSSANMSSSANYAVNSGSLNGQPGSYYAPATSSVGIGSTRITLNTTTASLGGVSINNSSSVLSPFLILNNTNTQPSTTQGTFYYETNTFSPTVITDTTSPIHMLQQVMIRAVNDSNVTISRGQAVYLSGAQGNRPAVKLAIASSSTAHDVIGLVYDDISAHQDGWIITQGLIEGIDTRAYTEGAYIYLSAASAGYLTPTPPSYPNYAYVVAQALNSTVQGKLLVEPYDAYNQVNVPGAIQFSDGYRTIGSANATLDLSGNASVTTLNITSSAAAINPTSGALKVGGGTGIAGDLYVNGNISVAGSAFFAGSALYVSASQLILSDPLIYLAEGNTANVWDIGFVGNFTPTASGYQHTGLARDHTDGKWKLFSGVIPEPTNTINFASATYDTLKVGAIEVSSSAQVSNLNSQYLSGKTDTTIISTASNAGYVAASAYTANTAWNNQNASVAYATSALNSASLGGSAASIFASKTYADNSANSASLNAYNAASSFTATGSYNNQNASVGYSTTGASATVSSSALYSSSVGGNLVGSLLDTSNTSVTLFSTPTTISIGASAGSGGRTVNIGNGSYSSGTITINLGSSLLNTAQETINIGTGSVSTANRSINIGTIGGTTTIGNTSAPIYLIATTASFNANTYISGAASVGSNFVFSGTSAGINTSGNIYTGTTAPVGGANLSSVQTIAGSPGFVVQGNSSPTTNVWEVRRSTGAAYVYINSSYLLTGIGGATFQQANSQVGTTLSLSNSSSQPYPIGVKLAANGTSNGFNAIGQIMTGGQILSTISSSIAAIAPSTLSGAASVTTNSAHGLSVGTQVTISGVSPATYNGTYYVVAAPTTTVFVVDNSSGSAWVSGGTLQIPAQSSITPNNLQTKGLVAKGTASQTGNLLEIQNSAGSTKFAIQSDFATSGASSTYGLWMYLGNTAAVPSSNPVGGGYLYVDSGSLKYRGPSGTITTLAVP